MRSSIGPTRESAAVSFDPPPTEDVFQSWPSNGSQAFAPCSPPYRQRDGYRAPDASDWTPAYCRSGTGRNLRNEKVRV